MLVDKHPDITKAVVTITGSFLALSLVLKAFSVVKYAALVGSLGGFSASAALLGMTTAAYVTYQNWDTITDKMKQVSRLLDEDSPLTLNDPIFQEERVKLNIPNYATPQGHIEDNRSYQFTLELPETKDPQSYAKAVKEKIKDTMIPLRPKPTSFFDYSGAF